MSQQVTRTLSSLLAGMVKDPTVYRDRTIESISMDSRSVTANSLFIATAKQGAQRQNHIEQAIASGAVVIVVEKNLAPANQAQDVQIIEVINLDHKVSEIAARFYGHPSLALTIIAVTGTNGKTSVSQYIAQCLEKLGQPCGVIGTLGLGRFETIQQTGMTTPNPVLIQAALASFAQQGLQTVVLEASSHALQQGRLNAVAIDIAILTNLSRDHLDYHKTMEDYAAAKKQLFWFDSVRTVVINADDEHGRQWIAELQQQRDISITAYSQQQQADIQAQDVQANESGLTFELAYQQSHAQINTALLGRFNVDNLLATAGTLLTLGVDFEVVVQQIEACIPATGRMQLIEGGKQANIIIDFAHTPDALGQALQAVREHTTAQGQLWCVFGCGGDRDTGKRSLMANEAEQWADHLVMTADNPRSEDNQDIVNAMLAGITEQDKVHIEHDRKRAIQYAIAQSKQNDMVLVAGKGHEQYQEIAGVKYPFSDIEVVIETLQAANDASQETLEAQ